MRRTGGRGDTAWRDGPVAWGEPDEIKLPPSEVEANAHDGNRGGFVIPDDDRYRDMAGSRLAMIRAARRAAELARQHGQPLLLWRDGKVIRAMPDDLPILPEQTPREDS